MYIRIFKRKSTLVTGKISKKHVLLKGLKKPFNMRKVIFSLFFFGFTYAYKYTQLTTGSLVRFVTICPIS